jgi:hypothetical protein
MMIRFGLAILLCLGPGWAGAECVEGALLKSKFSRLNSRTVALTGGYGDSIVIRTSCKIKRNSQVSILKDSFCSGTEAVMHVDGEDCAAEQVYLGEKITENRLYDRDEERDWDDKID